MAFTLKQQFKKLKSEIRYAINPQLLYGDESFYTDTREAKQLSFDIAANLIWETFAPRNVVDIGCGEGMLIKNLLDKGVEVLGCDISDAALVVSPKDITIFQADATKPLRFNRKFDLAVCIEIAEHIPTKTAKSLVENVTRASDTLFFTAAPPGQGGVGHINEQPPAFWHKLFAAEGFSLDATLTDQLKQQLHDAGAIFWLWQNLMIYRKDH